MPEKSFIANSSLLIVASDVFSLSDLYPSDMNKEGAESLGTAVSTNNVRSERSVVSAGRTQAEQADAEVAPASNADRGVHKTGAPRGNRISVKSREVNVEVSSLFPSNTEEDELLETNNVDNADNVVNVDNAVKAGKEVPDSAFPSVRNGGNPSRNITGNNGRVNRDNVPEHPASPIISPTPLSDLNKQTESDESDELIAGKAGETRPSVPVVPVHAEPDGPAGDPGPLVHSSEHRDPGEPVDELEVHRGESDADRPKSDVRSAPMFRTDGDDNGNAVDDGDNGDNNAGDGTGDGPFSQNSNDSSDSDASLFRMNEETKKGAEITELRELNLVNRADRVENEELFAENVPDSVSLSDMNTGIGESNPEFDSNFDADYVEELDIPENFAENIDDYGAPVPVEPDPSVLPEPAFLDGFRLPEPADAL